MAQTKEFVGAELDFLKKLPFAPKKYNAKDDKSPLFGKEYVLFSLNGNAFAVNTDDEFIKFYDKNELWKVQLSVETKDGKELYSLLGASTKDRAIKNAQTNAMIEYFSKNYQPTKVDDAMLNAIS